MPKQVQVVSTSGAPQGFQLGPVFFLYTLNDSLNGLSCDAVMLTVDVQILRCIKSPSDVQSLQNDIDRLSTWPQGAPMTFNTDTCVVLRPYLWQAKDSNIQH